MLERRLRNAKFPLAESFSSGKQIRELHDGIEKIAIWGRANPLELEAFMGAVNSLPNSVCNQTQLIGTSSFTPHPLHPMSPARLTVIQRSRCPDWHMIGKCLEQYISTNLKQHCDHSLLSLIPAASGTFPPSSVGRSEVLWT